MIPAPLRFRSARSSPPVEVVLDAGGLSRRQGDDEAQRLAWADVAAVRYSPEGQRLLLSAAEGGAELSLPLDLVDEEEECDLDDLLQLLLDRVEPEREAELPHTYGAFRWGRIALWVALALGGVALAIAFTQGRAHWIVSAALSAMWLATVRYAGLGLEQRLTVSEEGCQLERLWSRRRVRYPDISALRIRSVEGPNRQRRLELELAGRGLGPERLSTLGAQTLDAYFGLRGAARAEEQR